MRPVSSVSSSMQHVVQALRRLRSGGNDTSETTQAPQNKEPAIQLRLTDAPTPTSGENKAVERTQVVELQVTAQQEDPGVKVQTNNKYKELLLQFNEFKAADAEQDALTAEKIASLQEQVESLQDHNQELTTLYDTAGASIRHLSEQLEQVQNTLAQLLDYEPPTDPSGGGSGDTYVTKIEINVALEGLSERLDDLTQRFEDMLAAATSKNSQATNELFDRIGQLVEDSRNSERAVYEARSDRNNAQLARLMTNLTIQVQASANFFKMQEDTMMRMLQSMFRNGSMGSLFRTAMMQSFGGSYNGNRLNTFA